MEQKWHWMIIVLLIGLSIAMAITGAWAMRNSPVLLFDGEAVTLREGIEITHIDDIEVRPTDLWKLPTFTTPRREQEWWQAQERFSELLHNKDHVILEFRDRLQTTWQIVADIGKMGYGEVVSRLGLVYIVCLIYIISAVTALRRHATLAGFLCALFLASTALYMISVAPVLHRPLFLDPQWLNLMIKVFFVSSTGQISLVHFAMIFPKRKRFLQEHKWVVAGFYGYAALISVLYLYGMISLATTLPFLFIWIVIMLAGVAHSMIEERDEFMRKQMRMTFFALLLVSAFFTISIVFPWPLESSLINNMALFSLILPFSLILSLDNQRLYMDRIAVEVNARKEKERIHRELHDTVLNDLASISIVAEGARRFLGSDSNMVDQRLQKIKDYTADSSRQLRNFLWVIDDRQNTWGDVIDSLRRLGNDLLSSRNIVFEIETHGEQKEIQPPSPAAKHAVYQIFREALINVSKHAQATQVLATVTFGNACVVIVISDNGRGFDTDQVRENSYGLKNIRQRITEIGGELVIRSASGEGTQLIVQLPT